MRFAPGEFLFRARATARTRFYPRPARQRRARAARAGARRRRDRDARRRRRARLVVALPALPLALRRPRARDRSARLAFDGACLRGKWTQDHLLGYAISMRLLERAYQRLAADAAAAPRRLWTAAAPERAVTLIRCRRGAWRSRARVAGARATRSPRRSSSPRGSRVRARPVHDALRLRRRRGADLDQRRPGRRRTQLVHTIRAVGAVTEALCGSPRGDVLGVRGPFGSAWPLEAAAGQRRARRRRRASASRRCARRSYAAARRPRRTTARVALLYGARTPADLLYRAASSSAGAARFDVDVDVTVDRAGRDWRGHGRRRHRRLLAGAPFDPARRRSRSSAAPRS